MFHAFVGAPYDDPDRFERKLFVVRKRFEKAIEVSGLEDHKFFYFASLSCRTLVYKGMLTPEQLGLYFADDLGDPLLTSALAMFHSRFSTNTFPSWELAHPYRMISHNGEINTLRGNINWMRAREALFASDLYEPGDVAKLLPIIREGLSDTACLDNAVELLVKSGYSLPHAMMMLVPEAWENHETMSQAKRDFYRYHTCLMEAWDGPASITFTDGKSIGAVLDRNGLRPSRYWVTKDGRVIMASEVGVLDVTPEDIVKKGRLEPGRMFLIDLEEGRIVDDEELKHSIATAQPYGKWLEEFMVPLAEVPEAPHVAGPDHDTLLHRQQSFGYTLEDLKYILAPMGSNGEEAIGSMGTDTPLAVLSDRAQPLFNYFKQLFAQVTNPPLDAIREELVTSVLTGAGGEGNLLMPTPESCRQIALETPILDNDELAKLKQLSGWRGFKSAELPMLFPAAEGAEGLEAVARGPLPPRHRRDRAGRQPDHPLAPRRRRQVRADPVAAGDRRAAPPPRPRGAADQGRAGARVRRRPRGPPLRPAARLRRRVDQPVPGVRDARRHDRPGLHQGWHRPRGGGREVPQGDQEGGREGDVQDGHQHDPELPRRPDLRGDRARREVRREVLRQDGQRIGGIGLAEIAAETLAPPRAAPTPSARSGPTCSTEGGQYQWRRDGEYHLFNPETVFRLQHATRAGKYDIFKQYTKLVDDQNERLCTLRGLFALQGRPEQRRSRSRRSSPSSRSSSGSPPARCRTARSAARPTRRWPSP